MRRNLFWLSDEQWCRIEPHLPRDVRGKERVNDRRVISGILHDPEDAAKDADDRTSTHVKAHRSASGAKGGAEPGDWTLARRANTKSTNRRC